MRRSCLAAPAALVSSVCVMPTRVPRSGSVRLRARSALLRHLVGHVDGVGGRRRGDVVGAEAAEVHDHLRPDRPGGCAGPAGLRGVLDGHPDLLTAGESVLVDPEIDGHVVAQLRGQLPFLGRVTLGRLRQVEIDPVVRGGHAVDGLLPHLPHVLLGQGLGVGEGTRRVAHRGATGALRAIQSLQVHLHPALALGQLAACRRGFLVQNLVHDALFEHTSPDASGPAAQTEDSSQQAD